PEVRDDVKDKTAEEAKIAKIEATAAAQKAGNDSKSKNTDVSDANSDEEISDEVRIPESPLSVHNSDGDIDTRIKSQKEKLEKLTDNPNNQDPKIQDLNQDHDIESRGGDEGLAKMPAPPEQQTSNKEQGKGNIDAKAKSSGTETQPEAKGNVPKGKGEQKSEEGEVNNAATENAKGRAEDKTTKSENANENKSETKQNSENADADVRNENSDAPQY
ncbi:MAG: hypothetical protein ABW174_13385, partial [Flavitalea sp.]